MDSAVLLRFIADCSPAPERETVEDWLAAAEGNRVELDRLERAWELAARAPRMSFNEDALWERIRSELDGAAAPPSASGAPAADDALVAGGAEREVRSERRPSSRRMEAASRWRRKRTLIWGGIAAALIAVAIPYLREVELASEESLAHAPLRTYTTRAGELLELVLEDGTKAVLSGASTLRVSAGYGEDSREVYLEGAAYFEVVHDASSVFRVYTPRMTIEDLGTRFAVVAYTSDRSQQVAVAEGTVAVQGNDTASSVILDRNDIAHVSSAGSVTATRDVAIDKYFSWMDGLVWFDQDYVAHAAEVIRRRFGIRVHIADSALARRRFTGSVRAATIYDDLRALALLLDATYERNGRDVVLSSR